MKLKQGSLLEVAAQASEALKQAGIKIAVVGGSAITSYVPKVYTSKDKLAVSAYAKMIPWRRISGSLRKLDTSDPQAARRLKIALNRLREACSASSQTKSKSHAQTDLTYPRQPRRNRRVC